MVGISPTISVEDSVQHFAWDAPSQLVVYSDGLVECEGSDGVAFGSERLLAALAMQPASHCFDRLVSAFRGHLGEGQAHDDISLAVLQLP